MQLDSSTLDSSLEWGSSEWVNAYETEYGMKPMAGGESAGDPAAAGEGEADGESSGGDLYDLSQVPDAYRGDVEQIVKQIQGNVTPKFQEHAEFRKTWEPYGEIGLDQYTPEDVSNLLAFAEVANDPDSFREWWESVGNEYGFTADEIDQLEDGEDDGEIDPQQLLSQFEQMIEDKIAPLQQSEQTRQQEMIVGEAEKAIDEKIDSLKDEFGDFDEEIVFRFALGHDGPDALEKGFEDYQKLIGDTQRSTIEGKTNSPRPPGGEGTPNTNGKRPVNFDEASAMATERLTAALANNG